MTLILDPGAEPCLFLTLISSTIQTADKQKKAEQPVSVAPPFY